MIFAIEGPDGCGKTTVYNRVRELIGGDPRVRWPRTVPLTRELLPVANALMEREASLFRSLYDPRATYVTGRFLSVTGPAYAAAFARGGELSLCRALAPETTVLYLEATTGVLAERLARRGDDVVSAADVKRINDAYRVTLATVPYARVLHLDAGHDVETLARLVVGRVMDHVDDVLPGDLAALVEVQRRFNDRLQRAKHGRRLDELTEADRLPALEKLVLSTIRELTELLNRVDFKMHSRGDRAVDPASIMEEFVDAMKFSLNFFLYAPFDQGAFLDEFARKSAVVNARLTETFGPGFPARLSGSGR